MKTIERTLTAAELFLVISTAGQASPPLAKAIQIQAMPRIAKTTAARPKTNKSINSTRAVTRQ
jgi:hypothetical protein